MDRKTTDVDRFIGDRIRARRGELKVSQEALAAALGVTFQQVQKYENGINRIAASRLFDVANVLRLSVAELFPAQPLAQAEED